MQALICALAIYAVYEVVKRIAARFGPDRTLAGFKRAMAVLEANPAHEYPEIEKIRQDALRDGRVFIDHFGEFNYEGYHAFEVRFKEYLRRLEEA